MNAILRLWHSLPRLLTARAGIQTRTGDLDAGILERRSSAADTDGADDVLSHRIILIGLSADELRDQV